MADDAVNNSEEGTPVILRGVSEFDTADPELPYFRDIGIPRDDCSRYKYFMNTYNRRGTWGFVIFRTVYTPESDRIFASVLGKIENYVRTGLVDENLYYEKERHLAECERLVDIIMARFQNTIFEDKGLFDGATAKDLAPHFRLWLADIERATRSNGGLQCFGYNNFIVIDEKGLQAIEKATEAKEICHECNSPYCGKGSRSEPMVQIIEMYDKLAKFVRANGLWEEYYNGTDNHD